MGMDMTRRRAITAGATAAGAFTVSGCRTGDGNGAQTGDTAHQPERTPFLPENGLWSWSPPADVPRDLTPGTTPVRLAAFNGTYMLQYPGGESITGMVERIRAAGYTAANHITMPGTKNPWLTCSDADIRELKQALDANDVVFFDVHVYVNNIHPDMAEREKNWRHTIEQCEAAERVGCPMVTTHTGSRSAVSPVTIHRDNWTEETWKDSVAAIRHILKETSGMKVNLGIEALNLININNPRAHKRLIEDVGDPRCKVCLDPTNMICLATYNRTTELINECFDLLGEDIIAAHAKDSLVTPDRMSAYLTQTLPGTGVIDYELYLARLSRMAWPRPLVIEHLASEDYPRAKAFVEETAARVGVPIYGS